MISEETLKKLYNGLLEGKDLTTKNLQEFGFNSKDLNSLLEQGILERVKRGIYSFKAIDDLYLYGKELYYKKEYKKAYKCFEICFSLDPNYLNAAFQLFMKRILDHDYVQALELYDDISKTQNKYYISDNKYYLYLLNIISELPDKYKSSVKDFSLNDIMILPDDKRYNNIEKLNEIRNYVLEGRYIYAYNLLIKLEEKHVIIEKVLLYRIIEIENKSKKTVNNLIKEKKFEEVVKYLLNKKSKKRINSVEEYILLLCNHIINIKNTGIIPIKRNIVSNNMFNNIENNNFEIALELKKEYDKQHNISHESSDIYLLLVEICNLIEEKTKKQEIIEEKIENELEQEINLFSLVVSYLLKSDIDNAIITLKEYLSSINKNEYEFLILNLIKISLIEKDLSFVKPITVLSYVSKDDYKYDISEYIREFYINLSQNNLEKAEIYLNIIKGSNKITKTLIETTNLEKTLQAKKLEEEPNITTDKHALKEVKTVQQLPADLAVNDSKSEITSTTRKNSEEEFIERNYQILLKNKGMILLKTMPNQRISRLCKLIRHKYQDLSVIKIDEGNNKRLVLLYAPHRKKFRDYKELIVEINQCYNDMKYEDCIKKCKEFITYGGRYPFVFAKIGLSYLKIKDSGSALDYFKLATLLSKEMNDPKIKKYDFTEIIYAIENKNILEEEKKPVVKMDSSEFRNDVHDDYGIKNLNEVISYISKSKLDVETACTNLGLSKSDTDVMKLIFAKFFYSKGNYKKGDQFIKSVEKSQHKSKQVIGLLDEIRKNKKFYLYRNDTYQEELSLALKPCN